MKNVFKKVRMDR